MSVMTEQYQPGQVSGAYYLATDGRWYLIPAGPRVNNVGWAVATILFFPLAIAWILELRAFKRLTGLRTPCGHFYTVKTMRDGRTWLVPGCGCKTGQGGTSR